MTLVAANTARAAPENGAIPGICVGRPSTVIPFGGSISNNDALAGVGLGRDVLGPYLVQQVGISHFGDNRLISHLPQRDSSGYSTEDFAMLRHAVESAETVQVVVTTGLTKLTDIGRYLELNLPQAWLDSHQLILTGSYELFHHHPSDGKFNLGFAMAQRLSNDNGVFLAMNAGLYRPSDVFVDLAGKRVSFLDRIRELSTSPLNPDLLVIGFGGTIEGQDLAVSSSFREGFCSPYVRDMIRPMQSPAFFDLAVTFDSTQVNLHQIKQLAAIIQRSNHKQFVFTVGTLKAENILDVLRAFPGFTDHLVENGKRVIGVCALELPTSQSSDAFYNLGFALGGVPHLQPGLYLGVHGVAATAGTLTKNVKRNRFDLAEAS